MPDVARTRWHIIKAGTWVSVCWMLMFVYLFLLFVLKSNWWDVTLIFSCWLACFNFKSQVRGRVQLMPVCQRSFAGWVAWEFYGVSCVVTGSLRRLTCTCKSCICCLYALLIILKYQLTSALLLSWHFLVTLYNNYDI